jgi:hypothetical protein
MMRLIPTLVVALVVVVGLAAGCIPRHPPHTPQPVPETPTHKASPADQQSEMKN